MFLSRLRLYPDPGRNERRDTFYRQRFSYSAACPIPAPPSFPTYLIIICSRKTGYLHTLDSDRQKKGAPYPYGTPNDEAHVKRIITLRVIDKFCMAYYYGSTLESTADITMRKQQVRICSLYGGRKIYVRKRNYEFSLSIAFIWINQPERSKFRTS